MVQVEPRICLPYKARPRLPRSSRLLLIHRMCNLICSQNTPVMLKCKYISTVALQPRCMYVIHNSRFLAFRTPDQVRLRLHRISYCFRKVLATVNLISSSGHADRKSSDRLKFRPLTEVWSLDTCNALTCRCMYTLASQCVNASTFCSIILGCAGYHRFETTANPVSALSAHGDTWTKKALPSNSRWDRLHP